MPAAASHEDIYDLGGGSSGRNTSRSSRKEAYRSSFTADTTAASSSVSSPIPFSSPANADCIKQKSALDENLPIRSIPSRWNRCSDQDYHYHVDEDLFIILQQQTLNKHRQPSAQLRQFVQSDSNPHEPDETGWQNSDHHHHISMKKQLSSPLSSSLKSADYITQDHSDSTVNFYINEDTQSDDPYNQRKHLHLSHSSSFADLDNLMLLYDSSQSGQTLAHQDPSTLQQQQQYLTIEELKVSRNSCWLCGCNWQQDHVSLDCPECGGYALTRPCPRCDGKCKQTWQRNLSMTHDSHKAAWTGQCSLIGCSSGSSTQTRTHDIEGSPVSQLAATLVEKQSKSGARAELGALSHMARPSSCCSSTPSSVASSDSEL